MQGMRIETCKTIDYDSFAFMTGKKTTNNVEGKRFEIRYKTDAPVAPSPLQIIRNHQQAIAKIGGTTIYEIIGTLFLRCLRMAKKSGLRLTLPGARVTC
jgi:hypothetical protein